MAGTHRLILVGGLWQQCATLYFGYNIMAAVDNKFTRARRKSLRQSISDKTNFPILFDNVTREPRASMTHGARAPNVVSFPFHDQNLYIQICIPKFISRIFCTIIQTCGVTCEQRMMHAKFVCVTS